MTDIKDMNKTTTNYSGISKSPDNGTLKDVTSETARHLFTVLGIMFNDADDLTSEGKHEEAKKICDEATEYAESWKQEALSQQREQILNEVDCEIIGNNDKMSFAFADFAKGKNELRKEQREKLKLLRESKK